MSLYRIVRALRWDDVRDRGLTRHESQTLVAELTEVMATFTSKRRCAVRVDVHDQRDFANP